MKRIYEKAGAPEILISHPARKFGGSEKGRERRRTNTQKTSSDDSRDVVVTLPQASEWHYRGRAGPEAEATQPIPAPTGLGAQKDEGFQRFYKAVVSPTHVRVTAGGRIVPNTRGPPSPNPKIEATAEQQQDSQVEANALRNHTASAAPVPLPLGYPTPWPGYPAALLGPHQFPFPHIPLGFNFSGGLALPQAAVSRNGYGQVGDPVIHQAVHGQGLDGAGSARAPPPAQYDASRPCFVNGQWMLPLGATPFPYGIHPLVASAGYMGGQYLSSGLSHTQAHSSMPTTNTSHPTFDGQITQNAGTPATTPLGAPVNPPISSIRPSQITRSHIESLRQNLKRVEDQLQYNVHQIDVKHMEGLAREIRHSIRALEEALPRQLEFEELHYPKPEKDGSRHNGVTISSANSQAAIQPNGAVPMVKTNGAAGKTPGNSNKAARGIFSVEGTFPRTASSGSEQSRRFSGLPMTAAAAPPFRPSVQPSNHQLGSSSEDGYKELKEEIRKRLLSLGSKSFREMTASMVNEEHSGSVRIKPNSSQNGFAGTSDSSNKQLAQRLPQSQPYLVGSVPPGTNTKAGDRESFVYPRELNVEEIRARHLYWGQAPRSAMKGLPKFDGKDFYPPSPSKLREDPLLGTLGTLDSSQTVTDPFSSTDSRKAEGPTRATSCSETEDLMNGSLNQKKDGGNGFESPKTVRGRRQEDRSSGRRGNELLQSMLKRGSPSSNALPGEVTSTTAHGFLPQYGGHAAASLTPTIANTASSRGSTTKSSEQEDKNGAVSAFADKRGENRPPLDEGLDESVRRLRI
ncbi:hypothetical protein jhhlp_001525 [Lomentospora prolificans]|uniref:Uncharacterized protein n=1 Tax=Lomentospora prolificans TaxID=41688 RepID=A0A2N3NIE8_9PEZI|nr:hypothetical protein jhhlp_001525 [Lomentospora prolificans]